jgi:hypothetical protein
LRSSTKEHHAFLAIAALILIARLAFAFAFPIAQISDYSGYFEGAQRLAGVKEGPLGSWDPVGPKLFYALPVWVFGPDLRGLGVTNAFVFVAGVLFLYAGARRAFDVPTAVLTALISLLSLSDLYFNNLACTEVLAGLSLNAIFYLAVGPARARTLLVLGLVLGLAAYNRSNMIVMGSVVLVVEWFRTRRVATTLGRTALVQGMALLIMFPLCWYNLSHFGRFTPVTSNSGMQVWYGNNPSAGPGSHFYARLPEEFPRGSRERGERADAYRSFFPSAGSGPELTGTDPYAQPDLGMRYALAWIRENPGRYLWFSLWRARQMYEQCSYGVAPYLFYDPTLAGQPAWPEALRATLLGPGAHIRKPDGPANPRTAVNRFVSAWYQVLAAGALAGFLLTFGHSAVTRAGWPRLVPGLIVLIYTAPFVLTIALNRYHVPVMGLLWTYLAHGLVQVFRALKRLSPAPAATQGTA